MYIGTKRSVYSHTHCVKIRISPCFRMRLYTNLHRHMCTHRRAHTQTCIHKHTHTHTHTRAQTARQPDRPTDSRPAKHAGRRPWLFGLLPPPGVVFESSCSEYCQVTGVFCQNAIESASLDQDFMFVPFNLFQQGLGEMQERNTCTS